MFGKNRVVDVSPLWHQWNVIWVSNSFLPNQSTKLNDSLLSFLDRLIPFGVMGVESVTAEYGCEHLGVQHPVQGYLSQYHEGVLAPAPCYRVCACQGSTENPSLFSPVASNQTELPPPWRTTCTCLIKGIFGRRIWILMKDSTIQGEKVFVSRSYYGPLVL